MSARVYTAVDGFRFVLFLGVFAFHFGSRWFSLGWGGVEAFLVIGSFFITQKFLKRENQEIHIGESFLQRLKRLYPVYLTIIIASVLFVAIKERHIDTYAFWYVFSAQNFRCLFDIPWNNLDNFLGHFWYIGLDVWLFLLWTVVLRLFPKKYLRLVFMASLIIGLAWRTFSLMLFPDNIAFSYVIPVGQLDSWSIGALVALNLSEKGKSVHIMWIEVFLGIVGIVAIILYNSFVHNCSIDNAYFLFHNAEGYMHNPITGNIHFFIALLSAGILRYCLDLSKRHMFLSSMPMVEMGGLSYELYCFHFPVLYVARFFIHNRVLLGISSLICTIILSFLWRKLATPVLNKYIK